MTVVSRIWAYHNTLILLASFVILYFIADSEVAHAVINVIGSFGYLGAVIAGLFFVSTFTVAPAAVVLFHLAQEFNPILLALFAGVGAVVGDLILYKALKDRVFAEIAPLVEYFGGARLKLLLHTPYFAWFAPVLGALIIASPFPDELGVSLLGLSKVTTVQFVAITFLLDVVGILLIVLLAQA